MAQMRRRYNTRSTGGSATPYTPYTPSTGGMPPVADADVDQVVPIDPKTGKANVQFNGSNSHDPDVGTNPGDGIDSYAWNFGDGSTGSGARPLHPYNSAGTYTVTLTVTDKDKPAKCSSTTIEVTVISIEPQSVNDGETAHFTVLGATDATAWSWSSIAPSGAKSASGSQNSPMVTFSNPNSSTTSVPRAEWFALAKVPSLSVKACGTEDEVATTSCKYTITCDITFPSTSVTATSFLTVNVPWKEGHTRIAFDFGRGYSYLDIDDNGPDPDNPWRVNGIGQTVRHVVPTSNVPPSSHFYDKVYKHEQEHAKQFSSGGIADTYYTLNDLEARLLQISHQPTKGFLIGFIQATTKGFNRHEDWRIVDTGKRREMEAKAYTISDPISPQYIFMNCGRFVWP